MYYDSFISGVSTAIIWAFALFLLCYIVGISRLRNYVAPLTTTARSAPVEEE